MNYGLGEGNLFVLEKAQEYLDVELLTWFLRIASELTKDMLFIVSVTFNNFIKYWLVFWLLPIKMFK